MFKKRIFTLRTLLGNTSGLIQALPASINARRRKRINYSFAEKLRLAATAVNGCIYCSYGHTKFAMEAGLTRQEIDQLLKGEVAAVVDESEAPALLFAQHFAESGGKPESRMLFQLYTLYGPELAKDILTYVREIQFGNLCGNTFEAFLSRLKGNAARGSNPVFEILFFLLALPVLGPIHIHMRRKQKG